MIFGKYPCCEGELFLSMPENTPAYLPEDCPHCKQKVWHVFSRITPMTYMEEDFLKEYWVDTIGKTVYSMARRPRVYDINKDRLVSDLKDQYIGRGTAWGNPFKIGVSGTRDQVCDWYETVTLPDLDVEPLRGKNLLCHCAPLRCHGHSIMAKLYGGTWRDYV